MKQLKLKISNRGLFMLGIVLVLIGIVMPSFCTVYNFGVYDNLYRALREDEKLYIENAARLLLSLNILRSIPHYLGAFFLADAVDIHYGETALPLLRVVIIFPIVLLVYHLIYLIYGIRYDFGIPALLIIILLVVLIKIDFTMVSPVKKALMIVFLMCSIQSLDLIPSLSKLPFGRGDTTIDIKEISQFMGTENILQMTGFITFALTFIVTLLLIILIREENRIKRYAQQKDLSDKALMDARIKVMEARTHIELAYLVHDLKTPLTSVHALLGVLSIQELSPEKRREYGLAAEKSVGRMNQMISEYLDENRRSVVSVHELFRDLLSQISHMPYAKLIRCKKIPREAYIEANSIRFQRMLTNLLENAYHSTNPQNGRIVLSVERITHGDTPMLQIKVADNGKGISPEDLKLIWNRGFSQSDSYGLGLDFVKEVIKRHDGTITVESRLGEGTTFIMQFLEVIQDDE